MHASLGDWICIHVQQASANHFVFVVVRRRLVNERVARLLSPLGRIALLIDTLRGRCD